MTQVSSKIVLPRAPMPIKRANPKRLVLYGPPKVGKTSFCAKLPNNLIIDFEEGAESTEGGMYVSVHNFVELGAVGKEIMEEKAQGLSYDYVTIDTITTLEEWCEWDATRMYMDSVVGKGFNRVEQGPRQGQEKPRGEWDSVLTLPNGAGYFWLRTCYSKWIDRLALLAPTIILIAHLKDKLLTKLGREVSAQDIDLTGKIKAITSAKADAIGYLYRAGDEGEQLRINFKSTDTVLCGSRSPHLKGVDMEADWDKIFIKQSINN